MSLLFIYFALPLPLSTPWFLVCHRFLYKPFSKNCLVGLKESTSLWIEIPVNVRLPTAGSPQIGRKREPHWELLLQCSLILIKSEVFIIVRQSGE